MISNPGCGLKRCVIGKRAHAHPYHYEAANVIGEQNDALVTLHEADDCGVLYQSNISSISM